MHNNDIKKYKNELYDSLMKATNNIVIILNSADMVVDCNENAQLYYNCDRDDILNKNFHSLCSSMGYPDPLEETSEINNSVTQYKKTYQWTISSVGDDFTLLVGDEKLDSKRKTEQSVKDAYLNNFVKAIPGSVFWKDINGIYRGCNNDFLNLAGKKTIDEIIGKTDADMPWQDTADLLRETDKKVMTTGISLVLEEKGVGGDGAQVVVLSNKAPLRDENNHIVGMIGTSVDITKQKELEANLNEAKAKAEVANQAKSEFIAGMSHDFRTPLNGVLSMAEVLLMKKHFPEQEEFVRGIYDSGKMLLRLVDDVLSFSQLEVGKFEFRSEPFDLLLLVEEVVSMVSHQAQLKNLEIIVSYYDSVPHLVIGDAQAVRRVLVNLMGNAIKFTHQGYLLISVDTVNFDEDTVKLQLSVEDTGIGIPADKIEYIFERFYRAHSSYSSSYHHGTGLGLTIVKQLVDGLGGTLGVNSQADQGSTFWCTLPFKLQPVPITASVWSRDYSDVRVLIVDDHCIRAEAIQMQLVLASTQVTSSDRVMNELDKAHKKMRSYQILIIDDNLLHISALELAKNIKLDERFHNVLLIFFTEAVSLQEAENIQEAGFFKQLTKPVPPTDLIRILTTSWKEWTNKMADPLFQLKLTKPKVLLVEDNRIVQVATKAILEELGCRVEIAENSAQAVKKAQDKPDIIFMDIGLSDDDGLITTNLIRKQETPEKRAVIIALTAHVTDMDQHYCEQAGMDGFLKKPASVEDFQKMLLKFAPEQK